MSSNPVVLRNAADTYVNKAAPSTNFDGNGKLAVRATGSNLDCFTYIYFTRPFPLGSTIQSATLRLYQYGTESATHTVTLKRVTSAWVQSKVTWDLQPTVTATGQVQVVKAAPVDGTEWAFDVTALMQLVADGTPWWGWQLSTNQTDYLHWSSSKAVYRADFGSYPGAKDLKPVLEVTWSGPPEAPTSLSPAGNRAVSIAKPILRFDFTDRGMGATNLQAVQVQINATNVWTSPSFDSGTVLTDVPQLDLSATAYAGLADGSSTYWRARVQDGAGMWSAWSAGEQFQRRTKGTLAISNPPVTGLISESTPPITWSLTGRTQTAWLVYLSPTTDSTDVLYSTGRITGTATSHTLPAGVIKDDSSYRVHVWLWDQFSRENTPNDPVVTSLFRDFAFDYDATVDPVTSLASTDLSPEPACRLTWTRATAPDSFVVRRDGVIVASGLTSAELSTGGTGYAYTDRGPDPRKSIQWRVDAVVNGKTSATNPTTTRTLNPAGIWLSDFSRDLSVQILKPSAGSSNVSGWDVGEESSVYTPLGAYKPILVTQALRGFEGSITGRIITSGTGTLAAKEAVLNQLKSTPGRKYYLTLANHTIQVFIRKLVIGPLDSITQGKTVTFEFAQVGNYTYKAVL